MLEHCIGAINAADYYTFDDKMEMERWLKSLRPQNRWKPSEEQINELSKAVDYYTSHGFPNRIMCELLEQLKKL